MKYNVHHYVTFVINTGHIEADCPGEAALKSIDEAWETAHEIADEWNNIQFAEESTGALVDVVGDEDFLQSVTLSKEDIYNGT